eukprot:514243_1
MSTCRSCCVIIGRFIPYPTSISEYAPYRETLTHYIIGDVSFSKRLLPPSYPGPLFAFLGTESEILKWAGHKHGYRAALLTFMVANSGSISYYAPPCNDVACDKRMCWYEPDLKWICRGNGHNCSRVYNRAHEGCFF